MTMVGLKFNHGQKVRFEYHPDERDVGTDPTLKEKSGSVARVTGVFPGHPLPYNITFEDGLPYRGVKEDELINADRRRKE